LAFFSDAYNHPAVYTPCADYTGNYRTDPSDFAIFATSYGPHDQNETPCPLFFCGDSLWTADPCEFCGKDAYAVAGKPDMNHDCEIGVIDLALFGQEYGLEGDSLSGDFSRNGVVGAEDFAALAADYGPRLPSARRAASPPTAAGGESG